MSLRLRTLLFFALIAAGAILATTLGLWLAWRRAPEALPALVTAGLVAAFGTALVTALVWLLFDEHVAKAIDRLAAAMRARAHGGVSTNLDTGHARHLGDLGPAAAALSDRLAEARRSGEARLAEATRALEEEKAHLAAILSEIPVAIMVVDERNRITLYDRQCVHVLGQVATLCLGRSVFEYLERGTLERALAELKDATGRNFLDADLPTADGEGSVRARIRPAAQGRGFMLAMEVDEEVTAERPLVFDFGLIDRDAGRRPCRPAAVLADLRRLRHRDHRPRPEAATRSSRSAPCARSTAGRSRARPLTRLSIPAVRSRPPRRASTASPTSWWRARRGSVPAARRFHDFARDAVLVAHNAPFDMAFLRRQRGRTGVTFDNPVLDTVLLSAAVFGETEEHTLDAIADAPRRPHRRRGAAHRHGRRHGHRGGAAAPGPDPRGRGIRTFGEAVAAMRRHQRLLPDLNR